MLPRNRYSSNYNRPAIIKLCAVCLITAIPGADYQSQIPRRKLELLDYLSAQADHIRALGLSENDLEEGLQFIQKLSSVIDNWQPDTDINHTETTLS